MTYRVVRIALGALVATTLGSFGCGDDSNTISTSDAGTVIGNITGSYNHYVTSEVKIGSSPTEANSYAFDLDNDENHTKNNKLGGLLAGLSSQLNVDMAIKDALTAGTFVILHSVRAPDFANATAASWQIYLGTGFQAPATPDLTGNGTFTLAANSPSDALIKGTITGGKFSGKADKVVIEIALLANSTLRLTLVNAQLEGTISAGGCMDGKLGGGISKADLETSVLPVIAAQLNAKLAEDGCQADETKCTSTDTTLLTLFDTEVPHNRIISDAEVKSNSIVQGILVPDVDLLNAQNQPGSDGVKDSVSVGIGFKCVKGTFTAPNEQQ